MGTLLLVRHSLTAPVAEQDAHDWPLSAVGRRRCLFLAAALAPWQPTRLVSSTEPKARETARITGALLRRPVSALPGLEEHDRRGIGFLPAAEFQASVAALLTRPGERVFGRETGREAALRFGRALATLNTPGATTVVVTHGSVLTLFLAAQGLVDPLPFWRALGLPALVALRWPDPALLHLQLRLDGTP